MTVNILTPGHIKCLEWLAEQDFVIVGLLTKRALRGYKKEVVPYNDRAYIMRAIASYVEDVVVVPQNSLNPLANIKKYKCDALASGDGFEKVELDTILRYNIRRIDIKLPGERSKKYSSSRILRSSK